MGDLEKEIGNWNSRFRLLFYTTANIDALMIYSPLSSFPPEIIFTFMT
jgi:hypothetical protein